MAFKNVANDEVNEQDVTNLAGEEDSDSIIQSLAWFLIAD